MNGAPLQAVRAAGAEKARFADMFRGQYALTKEEGPPPPGFAEARFRGWRLFHDPATPLARLRDAAGGEAGLLLGHAVDAAGALVADGARIEDPARFAIGLAGRHVLLSEGPRGARLHGDATHGFPILFDAESGLVGSSLLMCLRREIDPEPEAPGPEARAAGDRAPFGLTADRRVRRLPVSHALDLESFEAARFWPRAGDFAPSGDEEATMRQIASRLGAVFGAFARAFEATLPLTGGDDSRVLLACGADHLDHVEEIFCHSYNKATRFDAVSAAALARKLGREAVIFRASGDGLPQRAQRRRARRFEAATGFVAPAPGPLLTGLLDRPRAGAVLLRGNVMEILRAQHWKGRAEGAAPDPEFGLKRCLFRWGPRYDAPFRARWLPAYEAWLGALPEDARRAYVDLGFVEHNLPHFGSVSLGFTRNAYLSPFNDRMLIALAGSLPLAERQANRVNRSLVAMTRPALADVPFARAMMAGAPRPGRGG